MTPSIMARPFKPCLLIPVYNHAEAVTGLLSRLAKYSLPIILIDDGSTPTCSRQLQSLANQAADISLLRLPHNRGKGGAIKAGLYRAAALGYSHALQIDADGQHDDKAVPDFLQRSQNNPASIICAYPEYNESVPKHRYYLRYLTHIWVWINTLSFAINDTMCGFRVYPVKASVHLLDTVAIGDRMEFDTEFMVRWAWTSQQVINVPIHVTYPEGGISHFHLFRDNALISWMHTRLFFGMLWRLPNLLPKAIRRFLASSTATDRSESLE